MATRKLSVSRRASLELAVASFEAHLLNAAGYLEARGISYGVARRFRLGVVAHDAPQEFQRFAGRLSIPYLDRTGISGLRFRCLEPHDCKAVPHGKYVGAAGLPVRMFNVKDFFAPGYTIAVCEGEIDTISLSGMCETPAVGIGGVAMWSPHHRHLFGDYEKVVVVTDSDDAGEKVAHRIVGELDNAVMVQLPAGEDVNDILVREGPAGVKERLGL